MPIKISRNKGADKMKPITQLAKQELKNIDIIMFDCDGVTIKKGTEIRETETEFYMKTNVITDSMVKKLNALKKHFTIGFSSGRSLMYLEKAYRKVIDADTILQGENGVLTLYRGALVQNLGLDIKQMNTIRNLKNAIAGVKNDDILGFEPKQFLITVHCKDRVPEIEALVPHDFYCIWNGEAYDIFLDGIDKGYGMDFLPSHRVLAVGNGENDKPMLDKATIGVTTDKSVVQSNFHTIQSLDIGGEEVIDYILSIIE
jgi:hydroxymethylpyrimidine pyrophosphatase-like HAD family hydrolase